MGRARSRRCFVRSAESAAAFLDTANWGPGREAYGFNAGAFSLVDMLGAIVERTGAASLTLSTWTAAGADMARVSAFLDRGLITGTRWLVDRSFLNRQPALCAELRQRFGDDSIRVLRCHAKFALIAAEGWRVVLHTSANLNENRRIESFQVIEDPDFYTAYEALAEEVFDFQAPGDGFGAHAAISATMAEVGVQKPGRRPKTVRRPW
ncbi:MAG: hypothetical protein AAGI34_11445 [Pseudomonadota bacterium]